MSSIKDYRVEQILCSRGPTTVLLCTLNTTSSASVSKASKPASATDRQFVVKQIENSKVEMEFVRNEVKAAQLLAAGNHPNVVKFYRTFEERGKTYIVMEFIPGKDLYAYLEARRFQPLKESDAKEIFRYVS